MSPEDAIRLRHMLDASKDAEQFVEGRRREDLQGDRMLLLSLVKCIEIVGEAASKVSEGGQREIPELPWGLIVTMRHRLVHAYYDIDSDRVWDTVKGDLPPLMAILEGALQGL